MKVRGTKQEVWAGEARQTSGGLKKGDLKLNASGKPVSRKASAAAVKQNNLGLPPAKCGGAIQQRPQPSAAAKRAFLLDAFGPDLPPESAAADQIARRAAAAQKASKATAAQNKRQSDYAKLAADIRAKETELAQFPIHPTDIPGELRKEDQKINAAIGRRAVARKAATHGNSSGPTAARAEIDVARQTAIIEKSQVRKKNLKRAAARATTLLRELDALDKKLATMNSRRRV